MPPSAAPQPSPDADSESQRYPAHWEADVVLRDGGTAHIRPITEDDAGRLVDFYERVSDESKYYRFFAPYPRLSARDVYRFTHHDHVDRVGLAATVGDEFIATVRYDRIDTDGHPASFPADHAEVAFLVEDAHQGRGLASALLEHIAACARERDIRRFVAEVLPANSKMIKVFTDAGYSQRRSFVDGSVHLTLDLEPTEASLNVMRAREQRAEGRSVHRLLAPRSVAVIGAGRRPGGTGRTVLEHLLRGGFAGRVHAVNHALPADGGLLEIGGAPAHRSIADIPEPVDLAVLAVPTEAVPGVVEECGEHGVQGLVVMAGAPDRVRQRELVHHARSLGMRIIGPNAFGVFNTASGVRMNASMAPYLPHRGPIGLFTQSAAIGIAALEELERCGAGLTTFVAAGNRADVSGNDLLQYWYDDPDTRVVLMYLESLGNPRKFTRLVRRAAAAGRPVVVVRGGRHSGGSVPTGHAVPALGSGRTPDATVSALLGRAGVIEADTVTEMVDAGLLLARGPLPAGPRVSVVGNAESLGLVVHDACRAQGLIPRLTPPLPADADPAAYRRAVAAALADPATDAVVVTAVPVVGESRQEATGVGSERWGRALTEALHAALRDAAPGTGDDPGEDTAGAPTTTTGPAAPAPAPRHTGSDTTPTGDDGERPVGPFGTKPVVVAHVAIEGLAEALSARDIPAYPSAERAVRALAHADRHARWRRAAGTPGKAPRFEDVDEAAAEAVLAEALGGRAAGGPLTTPAGMPGAPAAVRSTPLADEAAHRLLAAYGIHVLPALPAPTEEATVEAAERLGYPVALKTTAPHLRHRADLGGIRLGLGSVDDLLRARAGMIADLGGPAGLRPVVQPMAPRGVDTVVRAVVDPSIGAVLSFGLAGPASELLGDLGHALLPLTDRAAAEVIRSIRAAPMLFGWRGAQPVDTAALEEMLLRLGRLVDDHPEVAAVDLEPVVVSARGVAVLSASVRVAPAPPRSDLGPRRLASW
ncbi:GNAT family N-acetyltransferase [Streptomyces sp. ST2-7A]|uniref:bifunctional acetate--CoA ligase family protein/GNAT family N-acetyltransferase n=1 Tax=Streptomyces sp. ST2-7A TaxID=2907214 RepID=UPI001F16CEFF|nr:GNAT family N-acetyltransferase [Streptomyces sp. ST2-7A]MCE7081257.1 GNAT family N-acetyltransferase [Streptomyces sp. ST2-7A]